MQTESDIHSSSDESRYKIDIIYLSAIFKTKKKIFINTKEKKNKNKKEAKLKNTLKIFKNY